MQSDFPNKQTTVTVHRGMPIVATQLAQIFSGNVLYETTMFGVA